LWPWDAVPNFAERLALKASGACTVRIRLGDPEAAKYVVPGQRVDADTVRMTDANLYGSPLRFDDEVLVNSHF
jgi:hypothetical protein